MNCVTLTGKVSGNPKIMQDPSGRLLMAEFRLVDTGLLMDVVVPCDVAEPIAPWLRNGQRVVVQGSLLVVFYVERSSGLKQSRARIRAREILRLQEEGEQPNKGGMAMKAKDSFHLAASSNL